MQFSEKLKQLRVKNEYSQEQLDLFDVTLDSLIDDVEEIETTDEYFCWKLCCAVGIIGMVIGWLLSSIPGINIGTFGIGGGIIGYAIGYMVLEIVKKIK